MGEFFCRLCRHSHTSTDKTQLGENICLPCRLCLPCPETQKQKRMEEKTDKTDMPR
jgi:hypothetical protein